MKSIKILVFIFLINSICLFPLFGQEQIDLLSGTYTPEILKEIIVPTGDWHPFPTSSEQQKWQKIPQKVRVAYIRQAEKYLNCDWETPKASVFLEYVRNGNRSNYQRVSFGRRTKLAELVIAECIEGKGRFLDDILNGIWAICEETYWGVPAHIGAQKKGPGLPDITEPTVDLFAAETGMLMAWTYYLLEEQLDQISPLIRDRIHYEVQHRIISVNLERENFWWMGFNNRRVNNWNPWICSNWLTAVLILEKDPERKIQSIYKIMKCLDNFMNPYPSDGGCDEGPSYWNRAGGSLYDCLELLHSASNGKINIFNKPLIQEIGRYIYRVYIHDRYFINFADAAAKLSANPSLIFRYGKSIKDKNMIGFGAFLAKQQNMGEDYIRGSFGCLGRVLPALFYLDELLNAEPKVPMARDSWMPELQVMGARFREGSKEGLYVAAKGGHNAESHNHNDVGNYIVYADGYPAIIDVGVETYTAKTFSSRRYEIWTMQSAYHNLPTVNGVKQKNGREFRATDVSYKASEKRAIFSLDISKAYPDEAKLKSWKRTITLNRGKNVIIRDTYELEEVCQNLQMSLMSWRKPVLEKEGTIRLQNPEEIKNSKPVYIVYDRNRFKVDFETIPIEDGRLRSSWGERLYRIILTASKTPLKDDFSIRFVQKY
ncbi:MAG: heparinase II/III family protein [Candidatus Aminicenantes bacterium]|nr:heparinase II/III family protein [Candidatus Aminicenantes bacterium]